MTWQVEWTSRAAGDLERLDAAIKERIVASVERLAQTEQGDVKRLQGVREWRLRVGDWRVRFLYRNQDRTLEILRVLPRGRAYDR